jgi:hypothetical protein
VLLSSDSSSTAVNSLIPHCYLPLLDAGMLQTGIWCDA